VPFCHQVSLKAVDISLHLDGVKTFVQEVVV
jgi:molybdenum cofactor biosynthesis enzyme